VSSIFAGVTILILSIFMVAAGPRWVAGFIRMQRPEHAERIERTLQRIAAAVGNYVGGALLQATIAAVSAFIMLTILGVPLDGPLIARPHQPDDAVGVLVGAERDRHPARPLRREAVLARFPCLNQLRGGLGAQRQIRDPVSVQVAELTPADHESNAAEATGAGLYAGPALKLGADPIPSVHFPCSSPASASSSCDSENPSIARLRMSRSWR